MNAFAAEEWRPYMNTGYEASSLGRVRNPSGAIVKPSVHNHGYLMVWIADESGRPIKQYVHRVVAFAFFGPPPHPDCHADHIDRVRDHNAVSNLRWMLPADNRATRIFQACETHWNSKLTTQQVIEIRRLVKRGSPHVATIYGVAPRTIRDIWSNKTWKDLGQ